MTYEYQVWMQQRQLKVIVGALKFRQRFMAGDVYGTIGRAAMDAWESLPNAPCGALPARIGVKSFVRTEVLRTCRKIEEVAWRDKLPFPKSYAPLEGRIARELTSQIKNQARHTRFALNLKRDALKEIGWAVEFELRGRIGHLDALISHLEIDYGLRGVVRNACERMKAVAWQMVGGNYGPWFTHKTRSLYDIYSVIQHEEGHWRYRTIDHLLPNVPLMDVTRRAE